MTGLVPFYKKSLVETSTWQGFERLVARLLILQGFEHTWLVGQSGDGGADVIATRPNKSGGEDIRWLVQVKKLNRPIGEAVINETISALMKYSAQTPLIVSMKGFTADAHKRRDQLMKEGIPLQFWDLTRIEALGEALPKEPLVFQGTTGLQLRKYQVEAIERILERYTDKSSNNALVVLATGLGKTVTAAEAVRRIRAGSSKPLRVLVLAHTVDLVNQLERSFWPFMSTSDSSCIISGQQRPNSFDEDLPKYAYVFATRDSVHIAQQTEVFPNELFDVVVVDECHHLGADVYESVLDKLRAGQPGGPFLIGLTATPWRPGGESLDHRFDSFVVQVDLPRGLKEGHLANVDYRIYTDNVDWNRLKEVEGDRFTPKAINRTLFITNWDDSVIERTSEAWSELTGNRRGIVFCGTIDHATTVANKINALGFTKAVAIASQKPDGTALNPVERSRILWDFAGGKTGILCAVDILNEGIDVPDVNLVVFQRVTHSRRIFIQQLGRGLRLKKGKDKVVVLDFVTDIRRFAEGLSLSKALDNDGPRPGQPATITLKPGLIQGASKVSFRRATEEDFDSKEFLTQWLRDMDKIAEAGEDASVLSFPETRAIPSN
ncbi:MAG: DEAD/DEAH box helicase family protein [Gammaproteobacteria bacterium]